MNRLEIDAVRKLLARNKYSTDGAMDLDWDPSPEYTNAMKYVGEKYRNVRYLPLDIPKFEFDDFDAFLSLYDKEAVPVLRIAPDVAEPWTKEKHPLGKVSSYHVPTFKGIHLYMSDNLKELRDTFSLKVYEGEDPQVKRLVQHCLDHFPMDVVFSVFVWEILRHVHPHQDNSAYWKCPTEFRMRLMDNNTKPTLWVADIDEGDAHFIELPDDTDCYCFSNGTQIHGGDYHNERQLVLFIAGVQHPIKTDELLQRSYDKYKDQLNYKLVL